MESDEPAWRPCRQCGFNFPREENRCPRCGTDQVEDSWGLAGSILRFLHIDPKRIREAFAKRSRE